jgi:hypothetical protein
MVERHAVPEMSLPKVIGLAGLAQSGKDTAGGHLVFALNYKRFAFADVLKQALIDTNPIIDIGLGLRISDFMNMGMDMDEMKKNPEVRRLLQTMGVSMRDNVHRGVWLLATMKHVDKWIKAADGNRAVITDVRFPNEFEACRKRGEVWYINRPGLVKMDHSSETALDGVTDWDQVLENDRDVSDLYALISALLV